MRKLLPVVAALFFYAASPAQLWEARHNLTADDFQTTFDDMTRSGFMPAEVNFVAAGTDHRYTAVWVQNASASWEARSNLTGTELQGYFDQLTPKGYMPTEIAAFTVDGEPRFAAVWEQRPGVVWEARYGLNNTELQDYFDRLVPKGYMPTEISAYTVNGEARFAVVWIKQQGAVWESRSDLTAAQFQGYFDELSPKGYIPTEMYAYYDEGILKYGGIWQKVSGTTWEARYGLSAAEYQSTFNKMTADNYAPYVVSSYIADNKVQYCGAWRKQYQPVYSSSPAKAADAPATILPQSKKKQLSISPVFQQTNVWCWLAVGEMIFKHYGVPNKNPYGNFQCGIIGSISGPGSICDLNCKDCIMPSGSNYGTIAMLANYSRLAANKSFYYSEKKVMTADEVMDNIDNNRPVIAGTSFANRVYYADAEHVVLITGYRITGGDMYLVINDPFIYTGVNPYILNGGKRLQNNQYEIHYNNFKNGVFWVWSVFNIGIR